MQQNSWKLRTAPGGTCWALLKDHCPFFDAVYSAHTIWPGQALEVTADGSLAQSIPRWFAPLLSFSPDGRDGGVGDGKNTWLSCKWSEMARTLQPGLPILEVVF